MANSILPVPQRTQTVSALGMIWEYVYLQSDLQSAYVRDTLSFRNRIRDGINEWQD